MNRRDAWLTRGLDEGIRIDAFAPSREEAWTRHIMACHGRPALERAVRRVAVEIRILLLVLECYRLQSSLRLQPKRTGRSLMSTLNREIRMAVRSLRRRPLYAGIAMLTLALGIGANTAIFSVVNAVLLRSMPYADADRLVMVWGDNSRSGSDRDPHSTDTFQDYEHDLDAASVVAGISPQWNFTLRGEGEPERVSGFYASVAFLPMLGVRPALGRLTGPDDARPGATPAVVISHALWQRQFGGDPDVIGRALTADIGQATIVGVLPSDFAWLEEADLWLPIQLNPFWTTGGRRVRLFNIVARIADGRTIEELDAQAKTIAIRLATEFPDNQEPIRGRVVPLRDDVVGSVRPALIALLGAVGLVLFIACANVANLMLVRADGRRREVAVRAALGASRFRLAREMIIESVILSLAGGVAGFALALAGVRGLLVFVPPAVPRRDEIAVDGSLLLFALALSVVAGIVFGVAPALAAMRANPGDSLKEGARGSSARRGRLKQLLVVGEVAIALVVAVGASLLLRSFRALNSVNPGFETRHVLSMDLAGLPDAERRIPFMAELYQAIGAVPGVEAAGEISRVPLAGSTNVTSALDREDRPVPANEQPEIDFRRASRGYFDAMGIRLVSGRMFEATDDMTSEAVVLINEVAAGRYFPGEDPIGHRITLGGGQYQRIIGVVGGVRHTGLADAPRPEAYLHTLQGSLSAPKLLVRTSADPEASVSGIRAAIRAVGPDLVISNVTTMEQIRSASLAGPRFNTLLFTMFAVLAIALSTIGAWGVMAYTVAQRTREFGVRISMGARPRDIGLLVIREGLRLALAGILIGTAGALASTRALAGLLFGVSPTDAATFVGAGAALCAAVLLAAAVTAHRATLVDPVRALQSE